MFLYLKKGFSIIISLLYIFVNYNFYNSIFREYTNNKIFHITTGRYRSGFLDFAIIFSF